MEGAAPEKTPQELANEFHMIAGQCVSEWAAADEFLFLLCHFILRGMVEHSAIVYYRTPSLDARVSLATELVGSVIPRTAEGRPHDDQETWTKLAKEFRAQLSIRNRIAHEAISPIFRVVPEEEIGAWRITVSGFELYARQLERARGRPEKPPLRIDELRQHLVATARIAARIDQFTREICRRTMKLSFHNSPCSPRGGNAR